MDNFHRIDNGGRRFGVGRRVFTYSYCFPEKRSGLDRRSGRGRRKHDKTYALDAFSRGRDDYTEIKDENYRLSDDRNSEIIGRKDEKTAK